MVLCWPAVLCTSNAAAENLFRGFIGISKSSQHIKTDKQTWSCVKQAPSHSVLSLLLIKNKQKEKRPQCSKCLYLTQSKLLLFYEMLRRLVYQKIILKQNKNTRKVVWFGCFYSGNMITVRKEGFKITKINRVLEFRY